MLDGSDTIAAIATAKGEGGIAIVRVSGDRALAILKKAFRPARAKASFRPAQMLYGYAVDARGRDIDEVMAVWFKSPHSYTRQDVCEIHTHGGISAETVLERVIQLGARPAEKGEFTYRAFLNGRLSLDRAEAVMSLISASSEQAARSSLRQLKGGASAKIGLLKQELMELITLIDAAADFPEEIDEEVTNKRVRSQAKKISDELKRCADKNYARIVSGGVSVVIAGKPNVGKSSIMNRLLGADRAIVTDIAGTTRDVINETVSINGIRVTVSDTAGIRESEDRIEKIGIDLAENKIDEADIVILVLDASGEETREDAALLQKRDARFIVVANKDDVRQRDIPGAFKVSARTGEGMEALKEKIFEMASPGEDDDKLLNLRHIDAALNAAKALDRMLESDEDTYLDLLREDLTEALGHLGQITGENVSETVIDGIFERFCVGK